MKIAYLIYEQQDAIINRLFIEQLQFAAVEHHIDLQLKILEQFKQTDERPLFVWNRTRNYAIAEQFEAQNIRVFNNTKTNRLANNKLLAQHFCEKLGIPSIKSFTERPNTLNFPFIMKSVDGHGGQEVFLCEEEKQVRDVQQRIKQIIYQPYIESNSTDIRLWMLGNHVLAAVKRSGKSSFKSNFTLGGTIEKFDVPPEVTNYAINITEKIQSDYIGIDFIVGTNGRYYFNELEDPVGARSYYELYDNQLPTVLMNYISHSLNRDDA